MRDHVAARRVVVPFGTRQQPDRDDPFARVLDALRQQGCSVRVRASNSARCTCPVHDDRNPSLVVTLKDGKVVMRCFAGCRNGDIVTAIGLRMADLFKWSRRRGAPAADRRRLQLLRPGWRHLRGESAHGAEGVPLARAGTQLEGRAPMGAARHDRWSLPLQAQTWWIGSTRATISTPCWR